MYVLDTSTISDYLRANQGIINHFRQTSFKLIYTTSISKFELEYGLNKKPKLRQAYGQQLELLFGQIGHLEFDGDCAIVAAQIKYQLLQAGTPISIEDLIIAAIAKYHNFTVVTSNTKHFKKIAGLKIEDWKTTDNL